MQPSSAHSRVGVVIEGRVQGVGFRWWTRREALRLGLSGTIRNLPEGAVEVHVTGPADTVTDFLSRLQEGPPGARVDRVRTVSPAGDLPRVFQVIR